MVRLRVDGDHGRRDDLRSGRRRIAREGECQHGRRDRGDRRTPASARRRREVRRAGGGSTVGPVLPSARRRRRRHLEGRILGQDGALESLQLRPGLEPELPGEQAAAVTVDLERVALSAAAVEGQHRLPAQPLPQRVRRDEGVELPDDLAVTAEARATIRTGPPSPRASGHRGGGSHRVRSPRTRTRPAPGHARSRAPRRECGPPPPRIRPRGRAARLPRGARSAPHRRSRRPCAARSRVVV